MQQRLCNWTLRWSCWGWNRNWVTKIILKCNNLRKKLMTYSTSANQFPKSRTLSQSSKKINAGFNIIQTNPSSISRENLCTLIKRLWMRKIFFLRVLMTYDWVLICVFLMYECFYNFEEMLNCKMVKFNLI
jgi:hypothetical protein